MNSHLIIVPDFPHKIKIRLAPLKSFFCCVLTLQNFCPVGKTYITYIHIMFFYNAKLICFWHMYYTNLSNYIQSLETTLLTRTYFCAGFFTSLNRVFFVCLLSASWLRDAVLQSVFSKENFVNGKISKGIFIFVPSS